jgi:hypothetical protein
MLRNLIYNLFRLLGGSEARALEEATHRPAQAQLERLISIISRNQNTAFGSQHGFSSVKSIRDFQSCVPIRTYDELSPYIERMTSGERNVLTAESPIMFARTSGTTASAKYIPVTPEYLREFRRASVVSGYHTLRSFPGIASGVALSVVSSAREGLTAGGLPYGAISGYLFEREPALIKRFVSPIPYSVFQIPDWETRYYAILRLAIQLPISFIYTLNPSTIMLLSKRLFEHRESLVKDIVDGAISTPDRLPSKTLDDMSALLRPDKPRARRLLQLIKENRFTPEQIWPQLKVICCWTKAAASFYLNDFPEHFGQTPICDITYGASEGRGSVFLSPQAQVLALRSHFFEFIPEAEIDSSNPTILLANDLEVGKNYYILFTTSGGLYRYNINDVVKVTAFHNNAPAIEFQHKGGNISSFTGEKISESQVTEALSKTLCETGIKLRFFTVIPEFKPAPHYQLLVEPDRSQNGDLSLEAFRKLSNQFEQNLGRLNVEYKGKRESLRLAPVEIAVLPAGTYEQLRKRLASAGVADAQIKISHLNPKADIKSFLIGQLAISNPGVIEPVIH